MSEYPDYTDSFVVSGPLTYQEDKVDYLTGQLLIGRGGKFFRTWEDAFKWVSAKFVIVEVLYDAELYGNRWAFRVTRIKTNKGRQQRRVQRNNETKTLPH